MGWGHGALGWAVAALMLLVALAVGETWRAEVSNHALTRATLSASGHELTALRTRGGDLAYENQVLTLSKAELEQRMPSLQAQIEELRLRVRRTTSATRTGMSFQLDERLPLRDSMVVVYDTLRALHRDTVVVQLFDYTDGYLTLRGVSDGTTQRLSATYTDTLVQVVYRAERPRPWLGFFSPRRIKQRVMLKNPNATLHFSETIRVE
jgi:hypothetical protein